MTKPSITPIDESREFQPHELFFSLTDSKGVIRYGNEVFTRISGYSEEELLGQPHNLIRHPDMPRAVFKLLWDYLLAGKSIAAYVKNMAKDGRYYWVLATVVPVADGFLSIRLKPGSPFFETVQQVYKAALKVEKEAENQTGNRKMAMDRALEFIVAQLAAAGFDSYDQFMSEALSQELTHREEWKENAGHCLTIIPQSAGDGHLFHLEKNCDALSEMLKLVFASLEDFKRMGEELFRKYEMIQELGPSLQFLALNARMAASRLGDQGIVQAAVADALGAKSKQAEATIKTLVDRMIPLQQASAELVFDIAVSRFEAEVARLFSAELRSSDGCADAPRVRESLAAVVSELEHRSRSVIGGMDSLDTETIRTRREVEALVSRIVEMKAIQLNGKIEAAAGGDKSDFSVIFEEASRYIESGRKDCDVLLDVLGASAERIEEFHGFEHEMVLLLDRLQDDTKLCVDGGHEDLAARELATV